MTANFYISDSYQERLFPIDTGFFTASNNIDLNSNLSDYVIVIKSNNIPISLDAYTANEFKLTFTVPDGYKAIGFINFGSNSVATYQQYWGLTQTGVTVWLRNFTAYATNGTGSANILCVKQIKH